MSLTLILSVFVVYTILLFAISWYTSRKADNSSYFQGNKKSPWFVVAYGMVGTSISGVTMYIGNGEFIHSSGMVHISSLRPEASNYDACCPLHMTHSLSEAALCRICLLS